MAGPKRPCATFGCPGLVDRRQRYCPRCAARPRRRDYDAARPSAAARGYGTAWRRYCARYRREHPLCVRCRAEGRIEPTTDVDHIRPVSGPDDPLFWDPANHQGLCHAHHSRKTASEDGGFGNAIHDTPFRQK